MDIDTLLRSDEYADQACVQYGMRKMWYDTKEMMWVVSENQYRKRGMVEIGRFHFQSKAIEFMINHS